MGITNSLDVGDCLKVWDLNSNQEIGGLNQNQELTGLKDLQLLEGGSQLGVRHDHGLCVWNLQSSNITKTLSFSLENSQLFVLQNKTKICLLYTSPSPRDLSTSRMPSSA